MKASANIPSNSATKIGNTCISQPPIRVAKKWSLQRQVLVQPASGSMLVHSDLYLRILFYQHQAGFYLIAIASFSGQGRVKVPRQALKRWGLARPVE